jgi:predicted RNase H-like HicB family nuclease
MTFTITITQDEDGKYIAECASIPGCVSQGDTEEEVQANIRDAIKECLATREQLGMPLTISTRQIEIPI